MNVMLMQKREKGLKAFQLVLLYNVVLHMLAYRYIYIEETLRYLTTYPHVL